MTVFLWVIEIYVVLGLVATIITIFKEPFILAVGFGLILLVPIMILAFPYVLWVVFNQDNTGIWI